jgi:cobalamin biosynthesis Mg chelatase CobN
MTDVLLEGARKGYWRPDAEQTRRLVSMRDYLVRQQEEARPVQTGNDSLTQHDDVSSPGSESSSVLPWVLAGVFVLLLAVVFFLIYRKSDSTQ